MVLETKKNREAPDGNLVASQAFATVMRAYMECSDDVQAAIREMVEIVNDPESTEEEEYAALLTIAEALFPSSRNGTFGADLEESEETAPPNMKSIQKQMDQQEATFADRVRAAMEKAGWTQADLAASSGVGQPAISMMLARNGRPQRRTVEKIAAALNVTPSDLWPEIGCD